MEVQEAAVPLARPGEVVIKVGASGVCGSRPMPDAASTALLAPR